MFKKENLYLLGSLIKTHGVHGECILKINALKPENIHEIDSVFMNIDGLLVPYFISQLSDKDQSSFIIKFDDIDSKDKAAEFIGCDIYIPSESINLPDNVNSAAPDFTGYEIIDKKYGNIGRIMSILNIQDNPLFKVKSVDYEYLIPIHKDIIQETDEDKKIIFTNIPDGLLEI